MIDQDDLFDVKVDDFSKVGDCSNETVGLTNIEINVDGEAEGEVGGESDSYNSFDTKEHIFEDATTVETSNVRANKVREEKQKIDRDDGSGNDTDYIHSSDVGSYDSGEDAYVVCKINKARMWAKDEINGRFKYEFDRLFDYAAAFRQVDLNCNVDLMVVRPIPNHHKIFRRFYICFGATKNDFIKYCDGAGFAIMSDMKKVNVLN
ncbi:hypothetical protein V6N12_042277 [Hibiscus sabdariffa]|uniref:Transposase MuDR plant domain-containing protein n=1 Tax=Hibiscus sabdariffa TaxID=183260 RepID=A0ABR2EFZ7_9ROSI